MPYLLHIGAQIVFHSVFWIGLWADANVLVSTLIAIGMGVGFFIHTYQRQGG